MKKLLYRWSENIQARTLPARCLLCAARTGEAIALCDACRADLPWLTHSCRHCALPLAATADTLTCRTCRTRPIFDAGIAACHYDETIAWLVTGLKFRSRLSHARVLADLLAQAMTDGPVDVPDLLVPVPLHTQSFRHRGFNQAERIAHHLARRLDTDIARDAVVRSRATARQSDLRAARRAANVRNAFRCPVSLAGAHVAIVDDVVTTTRTAAAVAAALRDAGAARIDCLSPARA